MKTNCNLCSNMCEVEISDDGTVEGTSCSRGEKAFNRDIQVRSVLTSTVRTTFSHIPCLSVRSSKPILNSQFDQVMEKLDSVIVSEILNVGDIVLSDVLDGVDIVSTLNMHRRIS